MPVPEGPTTSRRVPCAATVTGVPSACSPRVREWRVSRGTSSTRSLRTCSSMNSTTPRAAGERVTKSARSRSAGTASATATAHSERARNAWSFSASPMPTMLCGDSSNDASAVSRPVPLVTPAGSSMSASLLNTSVRSTPVSRMAARAASANGASVATIALPTSRRTPRRRSASTSVGSGASPSVRISRRSGKYTRAPFSATTASNIRSRSGQTDCRSGSMRPVTSRSLRPVARTRSSARAVGSATRFASAMVPS